MVFRRCLFFAHFPPAEKEKIMHILPYKTEMHTKLHGKLKNVMCVESWENDENVAVVLNVRSQLNSIRAYIL